MSFFPRGLPDLHLTKAKREREVARRKLAERTRELELERTRTAELRATVADLNLIRFAAERVLERADEGDGVVGALDDLRASLRGDHTIGS